MYRNNDNNIIIVISRIKHNYIIRESDNIMYVIHRFTHGRAYFRIRIKCVKKNRNRNNKNFIRRYFNKIAREIFSFFLVQGDLYILLLLYYLYNNVFLLVNNLMRCT